MEKIKLTKTLNKESVHKESKNGKTFPNGKVKVGINVNTKNGDLWLNSLMHEIDVPEQNNEYTFLAWEGDFGWEFKMPSWKDNIELRLARLEGASGISYQQSTTNTSKQPQVAPAEPQTPFDNEIKLEDIPF